MMSKAKARTAAAAASAKAVATHIEMPPQLAPPAFGSPEEDACDELPAGWKSATSRSTGEEYYVNSASGESQYDRPTAPAIDDDDAEDGGRRESLKARAAQAKAKAAKAAAATKTATKTLSNSEAVGAVRDELRDAKQRAAQSKTAERARDATFKALLPVLAFGEDSDDEFDEQGLDEAQSALEEMSRQVSSRLVDMTELLDEEKELRQEAESEAMTLRQELEALSGANRTPVRSGAARCGGTPVPAARVLFPQPDEAASPTRRALFPQPDEAGSSTSDEPADAEEEERRTYTPSDEELREAVVTLRAETEAMGMGKMRKALQSQRKWAVSEKRLRNMIRAIESGIEIDKTEDERVETVEMLSSTCMELQGTVQRQKKQLQAQRKQLTDAREQMIELQKYADAMKAENEVLKNDRSPPPVSGY